MGMDTWGQSPCDRGINKQDMFEDDEDYLQMTSIKTKMITEPSLGHVQLENIYDMNKTRMNIFFILIKKQKVILFGESQGQFLIPPTILV